MLHFTKNLCKELNFQFFFNFLQQISKFSQRFRKQLCFWSEHGKSKCRPFQFLLKFLLMQFGHFLKKPFVNVHNFSGVRIDPSRNLLRGRSLKAFPPPNRNPGSAAVFLMKELLLLTSHKRQK